MMLDNCFRPVRDVGPQKFGRTVGVVSDDEPAPETAGWHGWPPNRPGQPAHMYVGKFAFDAPTMPSQLNGR